MSLTEIWRAKNNYRITGLRLRLNTNNATHSESHNSRIIIQKQISLYERDSGAMVMQHEELFNANNAKFYRFLSIDQR